MAFVYHGIWTDDMSHDWCNGVRVKSECDDPYQIEISVMHNDEEYWTEVENIENLSFADMADFVIRNIDKVMTPEEFEAVKPDGEQEE